MSDGCAVVGGRCKHTHTHTNTHIHTQTHANEFVCADGNEARWLCDCRGYVGCVECLVMNPLLDTLLEVEMLLNVYWGNSHRVPPSPGMETCAITLQHKVLWNVLLAIFGRW